MYIFINNCGFSLPHGSPWYWHTPFSSFCFREKKNLNRQVQKPDIHYPTYTGPYQFQGRKNLNSQEFPFIDLATIHEATDNFSELNKLEQGGFDPIYKVKNEF